MQNLRETTLRAMTLSMFFGLTLVVASICFTSSAMAEVSFAGKTIEWTIPFGNGGGSDTWARFNAPFLMKHLPGNPTVIVNNNPGGGSTKGANLFASRAKSNGLEAFGTSGSTQFPYLLGDPRVRYEYNDWEVVMVAPTGGVVYTTPALGLKSAKDLTMLKGKPLVYASQGATSLDLVPMLAFKMLGMDVKYVFGFKGRGAGRLAFERGEANIDYQTSSAYLANVVPMVEAGTAIPLFSWGVLDDDGNPMRDPTFPDLPTFEEAYKSIYGELPSGALYDAYQAFNTAGFAAQKMLFLPKGTPTDVVEAWRVGIRSMLKDPEYLSSKKTVLGTYDQVTDKKAQVLFNRGTTIKPEVRKLVLDMLKNEYNVNFEK